MGFLELLLPISSKTPIIVFKVWIFLDNEVMFVIVIVDNCSSKLYLFYLCIILRLFYDSFWELLVRHTLTTGL